MPDAEPAMVYMSPASSTGPTRCARTRRLPGPGCWRCRRCTCCGPLATVIAGGQFRSRRGGGRRRRRRCRRAGRRCPATVYMSLAVIDDTPHWVPAVRRPRRSGCCRCRRCTGPGGVDRHAFGAVQQRAGRRAARPAGARGTRGAPGDRVHVPGGHRLAPVGHAGRRRPPGSGCCRVGDVQVLGRARAAARPPGWFRSDEIAGRPSAPIPGWPPPGDRVQVTRGHRDPVIGAATPPGSRPPGRWRCRR